MPIEIVPSSPRVVTAVRTGVHAQIKAAMHALIPGQSIKITHDEIAENSLRVIVSKTAAFMPFRFRVFKHADVYEVACVAAPNVGKGDQS
jgi:hypothetical protein